MPNNEYGKEIIRFGNWSVRGNGIVWDDGSGPEYFIDKSRLWETGVGERQNMWDWLVHLTEKVGSKRETYLR